MWFVFRPQYWQHLFYKIVHKFLTKYDTPENKVKATEWASLKAVTDQEALSILGIKGNFSILENDLIKDSQNRASESPVHMGGPAHINLLYNLVKMLGANKVIETGIAYGWSSLAILKALSENQNGNLYSVDMPYPNKNNEKFVGIVVPKYLRKYWHVIRKPDRPGINIAIKSAKGKIDLCHYDSDKSWWGRNYSFPVLWEALNSGGIFISDDIQDNLYFYHFVTTRSLKFAVVKYKRKFIGLIKKS